MSDIIIILSSIYTEVNNKQISTRLKPVRQP